MCICALEVLDVIYAAWKVLKTSTKDLRHNECNPIGDYNVGVKDRVALIVFYLRGAGEERTPECKMGLFLPGYRQTDGRVDRYCLEVPSFYKDISLMSHTH